jgi:hypothetical protein
MTKEALKAAGWPDGPELEAALEIESHPRHLEIGYLHDNLQYAAMRYLKVGKEKFWSEISD